MPSEGWKDSKVTKVWPSPPEEARIKLLRVVKDKGDLDPGKKGRSFLEWLIGKSGDELLFVSPYGISADGAGRVWVADPGSGVVHIFDLAAQSVEYLEQAGRMQFVSPVDVAYDVRSGKVYVSDSGLSKVFVFSVTGQYESVVAPPEGFGRPAGLAVGADSFLYVVDVVKGVVEVFSPQGTHVKSVGSAVSPGERFRNPSNVAVDAQGRLYVVDSLRFRVEVQAADGTLLNVIGQVGDKPGSFARPRGVAIDSSGHIYVVDAAFDNIQVFDLTGRVLMHFGGPGRYPGEFCLPAGLHIDAKDRIYVAESCNYRFQVFQFLGDNK